VEKTFALVIANGVWTDARQSCQLSGIHRLIGGTVCTHGHSLQVGTGSRVKRISAAFQSRVKHGINAVLVPAHTCWENYAALFLIACQRTVCASQIFARVDADCQRPTLDLLPLFAALIFSRVSAE
jgi:hypothetical protein